MNTGISLPVRVSSLVVALCLVVSGFLVSGRALANDQRIEIKLGTGAPAGTPAVRGMMRMADRVRERTNGRLDIQVFTDSQLGNERDLLEGVQFGTIHMSHNSSGSISVFLEEAAIFSAPFIWDDIDHMLRVVRGPVGEELNRRMIERTGIRFLDMGWLWGERHVTTRGIPVRDPSDLRGVRIRVPEIPIFADIFRALGATPVTVQTADIYMALQTGLAAAQENPVTAIYRWRFYEVQDYLILTNHITQNNPITINEAFYQSLSPEDQQILLEEVRAAGDWQNELVRQEDFENIALLQQHGMKVVEVDRDAFREATAKVYEDYEHLWGAELYEAIRAAGRE